MAGQTFEVGGSDDASALRVAAGAREFRLDIQRAVIVGNLLAGLDIADRDLKIEAGRERRRMAGMVDEAGVVPAQDPFAAAVLVGVDIELALQPCGELG